MKKILDNKIKNRVSTYNVIKQLEKEWKLFNLSYIKNHLLTQNHVEVYWINKPLFDDEDFFEQLSRGSKNTKKLTFLIKREDFFILTDYICGDYIEKITTTSQLVNTIPLFKQCIYDLVILRSNYSANVDFTKHISKEVFEKMIRKNLIFLIKDYLGMYNISLNYKEKIDEAVNLIVDINLNIRTYQECLNSIRSKITEADYKQLENIENAAYKFPMNILNVFSLNIPESIFKNLFIKNPLIEYFFGPSIFCDQLIKYSMIISKMISKTGIAGNFSYLEKFMDKKIENVLFEITYNNIKKYYN